MSEQLDIASDFIVLSPEKVATIEKLDSTLYERLNKNYNEFKGHQLISSYEFSEDWPTWEIHPKGDEIVILLTGQATFILQLDTGEKVINLEKKGAYVVVPRGTWHTAKITVKAKLLFITPGEGNDRIKMCSMQ